MLQLKKAIPVLFIVFKCLFSSTAFAQTGHANAGWFMWADEHKFSGHWGMHFDGQLRFANAKNLLLRPGFTYFINRNSSVTAGYAYVATYAEPEETSQLKKSYYENRFWEQYVFGVKLGNIPLVNRFRLEQRFIKKETGSLFTQRLRYSARVVIPLTSKTDSAGIKHGLYASAQNEIFFNVQNIKNAGSSNFLDQNRLYGALGYHLGRQVALEAGYIYQYINTINGHINSNIIQLGLYTKF